MARPPKGILCQRDQIVNALLDELSGGRHAVGSRLPSLRAQAKRFKTGIKPVENAMRILAQQGYIERRHGSGIYVRYRPQALRMADSAMLCLPATGHVHADLIAALHARLHDLGMFAATLDTGHGQIAEWLHRALYSEARFILFTGGAYFPFHALERRMFGSKTLIALMAWESDRFRDRIHRVIVDHAAAGSLLADHLQISGHRHILLVGPYDMIKMAKLWDGRGVCPIRLNLQGAGFAGNWSKVGGRVTAFYPLRVNGSGRNQYDATRLCAMLCGPQAPTAVIGIRDVDAWDVREILRRSYPEALDRLTFVGNGDTPWSRASHPPFTTLNWGVDSIAELACGIIRDVEAGKTFTQPVVRLIPPRLVVR